MKDNTNYQLKQDGIINTIAQYIKIKVVKDRGICQCPLCKDQGNNFIISDRDDKFKCFSCGESGDKVDFVARYNHITREEAMKKLNIPIKKDPLTEKQKEELRNINNEAGKYFNKYLRLSKEPSKYLKERGLDKRIVNRFGLGYAGTQMDGLYNYLSRMGFNDDMLIKSGLIGKSKYGIFYDKFKSRIMFPIIDKDKNIIGFGGRVLDDSKPKYINSPASPIFDKSKNLYGYNFAQNSKQNGIILCEGYMDVIALNKSGFDNSVAALGTAFNQEHAEMIKRLTDTVYVCFDSDEAGINAKLKAIPKLRMSDLDIKIINTSPCKDPDEFIKKYGCDEFQKRIDEAESSQHFEIRVLREKYPDDMEYKHEVAKLMLKSVDLEVEKYKEAYTDIANEYAEHSLTPKEEGDQLIESNNTPNDSSDGQSSGGDTQEGFSDFSDYVTEFEIGE